jgi:hypothetical protein
MTSSQKWAGHPAHPKLSAATAIHKQRKHLLMAIFRAALAVAAIVAIPRATAEPILTWSFQDAQFFAGQFAVGTFTVQGGGLTDWNVQMLGGKDPSMTNISFQPGGNCVIWCGKLLDQDGGGPGFFALDLRTSLTSDNKFFQLVVYFNSPLANLFDPATPPIVINRASGLSYEELLNTGPIGFLKGDTLSSRTLDARIVLSPEPASTPETASLFLFAIGSAPLAILATHRLFRRKTASTQLN